MPSQPIAEIVLRTVVIGAIAFAKAYILNQHQGLPLLLILILLVVLGFGLRRTRYGR
ncbi:hypothetical protein ACWGIN_31125 [Streptomyces sp. NPDC054861]